MRTKNQTPLTMAKLKTTEETKLIDSIAFGKMKPINTLTESCPNCKEKECADYSEAIGWYCLKCMKPWVKPTFIERLSKWWDSWEVER